MKQSRDHKKTPSYPQKTIYCASGLARAPGCRKKIHNFILFSSIYMIEHAKRFPKKPQNNKKKTVEIQI